MDIAYQLVGERFVLALVGGEDMENLGEEKAILQDFDIH